MALKDRLNDALLATPPENAARLKTLTAVKDAAGTGTDAEIQTAIANLISAREQQAASFAAAGQKDQAKAERAEIDTLRALLRASAPAIAPAAPKLSPKPAKKAAAPVAEPAEPKALVSKNQLILGLVVVAIAAVAGYFIFHSSRGTTEIAATDTQIVVRPDDRTMGNPKAPVTLLEYAAPTCPHCARFNATIFPHIKEEYIDKGKVFYIFRTFPLGPTDGAVEGIARACLPADKYFQFLDLMFRNQPKWDPDGNQVADVGGAIKQMARIMGVSPEEADRCMTDQKEQQRINEVSADAQARYHVNQTPTLVVNGAVVQETEMAWPQLKAKFDTLLSKK